MVCFSALVLGASLLLFDSTFVRAQGTNNPYIGCSSIGGSGTTAGDISNGRSGCVSSCVTLDTAYAFYTAGDGVESEEECRCGYTSPTNVQYTESYNTDDCRFVDQYSGFYLQSSFSFVNCYSAVPATEDDSYTSTTAASIPGCLAACSDYVGAYIEPTSSGSGDSGFICRCGPAISGAGTVVTCNQGAFYAYQHPAAAAASGLHRRSLRQRLERAREAARTYCPGTLMACRVTGGEDSYECIDTSTELESCGGCTAGMYGSSSEGNSTVGIDCSSLPGVVNGGVTCASGRCEAYACKKGWLLVEGSCVSSELFQ